MADNKSFRCTLPKVVVVFEHFEVLKSVPEVYRPGPGVDIPIFLAYKNRVEEFIIWCFTSKDWYSLMVLTAAFVHACFQFLFVWN